MHRRLRGGSLPPIAPREGVGMKARKLIAFVMLASARPRSLTCDRIGCRKPAASVVASRHNGVSERFERLRLSGRLRRGGLGAPPTGVCGISSFPAEEDEA